MEKTGAEQHLPLAQVEDVEELKSRYRIYSDHILRRWMQAVTGAHRQAMAAVLQERAAGQTPR